MRPPLPISRYTLLRKKQEKSNDNEIKLKAQARFYRYALYAAKIIFEGKHDIVHLHGTGPASSKVIQAVEYLKIRIKGLHTAYEISSTEFNDEYHPLEKGLDVVIVKRVIPTLKAQITITKADSISKTFGYMAPVDQKDVLDEEAFRKKVEEHFNREKIPREEGAEHNDRPSESHRGRGARGRGGFRGARGRGASRGRGGAPRNDYNSNEKPVPQKQEQRNEVRPAKHEGKAPRPEGNQSKHEGKPKVHDGQQARNERPAPKQQEDRPARGRNNDYQNDYPRRDQGGRQNDYYPPSNRPQRDQGYDSRDNYQGRNQYNDKREYREPQNHRDDHYNGPREPVNSYRGRGRGGPQRDNYNREPVQYRDNYDNNRDNRPQGDGNGYRGRNDDTRYNNYRSQSRGRDYKEYTYSETGKKEGNDREYEQRPHRGQNQPAFRGPNRPERGANFRGGNRGY